MDYTKYRFSTVELMKYGVIFLVLDGTISYLFFRSFIAFILGGLFLSLYFKEIQRSLCRKRKDTLAEQFLFAMNAVTASLTAGYSVETAFSDAAKELKNIYSENEMIMVEMNSIVSNMKNNRNLEELLVDLSVRSGVEDIRNFAELFAVAKRSGGNLIEIIRNTCASIEKKEEVRKEIQATLSAKRMEQNIMSIIPCFILIYVQVMSPGFLDSMYHNPTGIFVMGLCLCTYGAAVLWGRKIVEIEV